MCTIVLIIACVAVRALATSIGRCRVHMMSWWTRTRTSLSSTVTVTSELIGPWYQPGVITCMSSMEMFFLFDAHVYLAMLGKVDAYAAPSLARKAHHGAAVVTVPISKHMAYY